MTNSHSILIVDDDTSLCQLLSEYLTGDGFSVASVYSGDSALEYLKASNHQPHCIVMDIMMPGISGLEALQKLRQFCDIPVIMLTGRGDDIDRIIGLELGADDYLGKPCNPRELTARIKAILRRCQAPGSQAAQPQSEQAKEITTLSCHGITLEPSKREALLNDQPLKLTAAEFNVLHLLMASAGEILSKEFLTEQVLHRPLTAYDRSIDVHVSRVRQKLAKQGDLKDVIKTIRGSGYQMVKPQ